MVYVIQVLLTACEQDQDGRPDTARKWKNPRDVQRNCPKHVEFYSKNKLEKLVHLTVSLVCRFTNSPLQTQPRSLCSWGPRFRFTVKIFSPSVLAGGARKNFSPESKSALGGTDRVIVTGAPQYCLISFSVYHRETKKILLRCLR